MSKLSDFSEKVTHQFSKRITDEIFLMIQNDKELMYEYLKLVEANGLTVVNQQIGKKVKNRFALDNDLTRNVIPNSTLIKSHQEFE
jgi:hypothetical protein